MSLLVGSIYCQERNFTGFMAEVDSKSLVTMVSSDILARWPLCNVLRLIRALLSGLGVYLHHVFRQANSAVDALASSHLGLSRRRTVFPAMSDQPFISI